MARLTAEPHPETDTPTPRKHNTLVVIAALQAFFSPLTQIIAAPVGQQ